jgi:hypothetical protein
MKNKQDIKGSEKKIPQRRQGRHFLIRRIVPDIQGASLQDLESDNNLLRKVHRAKLSIINRNPKCPKDKFCEAGGYQLSSICKDAVRHISVTPHFNNI